MDQNVCSNLKTYFERMEHLRTTRNNNISLRLPKVRLQFAKKGFFYTGAKVYNALPREIREEMNFVKFKIALNNFF